MLYACGGPPREDERRRTTSPGIPESLERYDPLELEADRMIVPAEAPNDSEIMVGVSPDDLSHDEPADSAWNYLAPLEQIDSLNHQSYRIQLLTTKVYGEAKAALRVAEEIFDRPVSMDYEVPYFKLRVGNFVDRDQAESYQTIAKAAGYANAWVVMVMQDVEELEPLYNSLRGEPGDSVEVTNDSESDE